MGTLWVLTGNASFAKIFEVKGHGKQIQEIHHFDNPQGRMKAGEILQDRPGRAFDRFGPGRHALGTENDVKVHEQKLFADRLSAVLKEGRSQNAFDELAIVAPPQFLGEINASLDPQVKKFIFKEVDKDLPMHLSERERIDHLCKYLDLWNHTQ